MSMSRLKKIRSFGVTFGVVFAALLLIYSGATQLKSSFQKAIDVNAHLSLHNHQHVHDDNSTHAHQHTHADGTTHSHEHHHAHCSHSSSDTMYYFCLKNMMPSLFSWFSIVSAMPNKHLVLTAYFSDLLRPPIIA